MARTTSSFAASLRDPRLRAALLGVAYFVLLAHGLGAADVVGDDESREVGIVQDILRGNWLWPTFNGELLPDKPTLYHWLAAIPCALAGFSAAAVRLPAALAAAGLVAWTAWFGARLLGPPAGLAAGVLLATMPTLATHARVARPDTLLLLILVLALDAAFRWWQHGRRRDAIVTLALVGASVPAKGPVGPALFAVTMGLFLLWQRDLRRVVRLVTVPGLACLAVLGLAWYALAYAGWGERFVEQHLVGRYLRNLLGGLPSGGAYSPKSLWYHLTFYPLHLPAVAMPWTPLIVVALWRIIRHGGLRDARARFFLCWAVAPIVVFTPAEWKLRYYLLPSLPALALLTAPTAVTLLREPWADRGGRSLRPTRASIVTGAVVVLLAIATVFVILEWPDLLSTSDQETVAAVLPALGGRGMVEAVVGLAAGAVAVAVACQLWDLLLGLVAAGTLVWLAFGMPAVEAHTAERASLRPFAEAVRSRIPESTPLVFYGGTIRGLVVHLGRHVPSLRRTPERIRPGMAVIAFEPAQHALEESGYLGPPLARGEGRVGNLARAQLVLAMGVARPPAPRVTPPPVVPPGAPGS